MSISDNKMNALSDDELSAVTGGIDTQSFKTLDELNATKTVLRVDNIIEVDGVSYHFAGPGTITKRFVLFRSDTDARLWIPIALFDSSRFPTEEDSGNT